MQDFFFGGGVGGDPCDSYCFVRELNQLIIIINQQTDTNIGISTQFLLGYTCVCVCVCVCVCMCVCVYDIFPN